MNFGKNLNRIIKKTVCLMIALSFLLVGCGPATPADAPTDGTDHVSVNTNPETVPTVKKKRVAITFDDGPHNVRTREIVDELDKYGFTATFFVVGNRVDGGVYSGGKTVKYVIEHGHEVGIHGYTHTVYYDSCTDAELNFEMSETAKAIHDQVQDYSIRLMRPVGGFISNERVQSSPYSVIMWNVDSEDYKHAYSPSTTLSEAEQKACVDAIVENVMSNVEDGSIILMHDIYLSTVHATAVILERLHAEGYEVVSVSELLGNAVPGTKYSFK